MRLIQVIFALGFMIPSAFGQHCTSPNKEISVAFSLMENGVPSYQMSYKGVPVVLQSTMGFELANDTNLLDGFSLLDTVYDSKD